MLGIRAYHPSGAQPLQTQRLADRPGGDPTRVKPRDGLRTRTRPFQASVNFVDQQPRANPVCDCHDLGYFGSAHQIPRRIVRVRQKDHARAGGDRRCHQINRQAPAVGFLPRDLDDFCAFGFGKHFCLWPTGCFNHYSVARLQALHDRQVIRLRRAGGDQHICGSANAR